MFPDFFAILLPGDSLLRCSILYFPPHIFCVWQPLKNRSTGGGIAGFFSSRPVFSSVLASGIPGCFGAQVTCGRSTPEGVGMVVMSKTFLVIFGNRKTE